MVDGVKAKFWVGSSVHRLSTVIAERRIFMASLFDVLCVCRKAKRFELISGECKTYVDLILIFTCTVSTHELSKVELLDR